MESHIAAFKSLTIPSLQLRFIMPCYKCDVRNIKLTYIQDNRINAFNIKHTHVLVNSYVEYII